MIQRRRKRLRILSNIRCRAPTTRWVADCEEGVALAFQRATPDIPFETPATHRDRAAIKRDPRTFMRSAGNN
jgi:hypothetical protein